MAYALPNRTWATLTIHDVSGHNVRTLVDEVQEGDQHAVRWNGLDDSGRTSASGLYVAPLAIDGERRLRKLVLVR